MQVNYIFDRYTIVKHYYVHRTQMSTTTILCVRVHTQNDFMH